MSAWLSCGHITPALLIESFATRKVRSLPPCGGGLGRGVPHGTLFQSVARQHACRFYRAAPRSHTFDKRLT